MDRALYLLHLPVFAFATGLLMPRPVERDGRARYLRARLSLLAYLFLLWTLIEGSAEVLTSSVKNVPVTWWQVLSVWRPLGPLWFLPLLMLATVVVVILSPWYSVRLGTAFPLGYYGPVTRAWEFLAGCLLALVIAFVRRLPRIL